MNPVPLTWQQMQIVDYWWASLHWSTFINEPTVGHFDFRSFGGLKNTDASGVTGDIDLTTLHHTNNDAYTIILELKKSY